MHTTRCNAGVICTVYRYYRGMYSCMSDWLQSQSNCSDEVTTVVLDAVLYVTAPFTSNYDCTIIGMLFHTFSFVIIHSVLMAVFYVNLGWVLSF